MEQGGQQAKWGSQSERGEGAPARLPALPALCGDCHRLPPSALLHPARQFGAAGRAPALPAVNVALWLPQRMRRRQRTS